MEVFFPVAFTVSFNEGLILHLGSIPCATEPWLVGGKRPKKVTLNHLALKLPWLLLRDVESE